MKKFCCNHFEINASVPSTTAPNIRIVKFLPTELLMGDKLYGFYITLGYDKFSILLPKLNISYCPYCGTKLKNWYSSDEYANEIEGVSFNL